MRVIRIILVSLLLAGLLPGIGAARTRSTEIVLSGRRSASVTFTLHEPVRLACCDYEAGSTPGEVRVVGMSTRTTGTYAGFAIERVRDGRMIKLAVHVPPLDLDDGKFPTVIMFGRARQLPEGRYRIHLLTDGRSTVRIEARGLPRDLVLEPRRQTGAFSELVELGADSLQKRVPLEIRRGVTVLQATKTQGENTQAHYLSQCVAPAGSACAGAEDHEPWITPGSARGGGTMMQAYVGDLQPGEYDAIFSAASVGTSSSSVGFVLMFGKEVWLDVPEAP